MNWKYGLLVIVIAIIVIVGVFYLYQPSPNSQQESKQSIEASPTVIASNPPAKSFGVHRILSPVVSAGSEVEIVLNVSVGDSKFYVIDEKIPEGWTIVNAAGGSTEDKGHIKWVELNAKDSVIKYRLSVPDKPGKYIFSGTFALDKQELFIIGNNEIVVE